MGETAYLNLHNHETELEHRYGPQVHLIHDPLALTWLLGAALLNKVEE